MIEATIGTMTMGAGKGIFQSPIRWILKTRLNNFKKVIVFDGALDEESEEFYKTLENVEVVDMPWDDKYVARYRAFADRLENDEWGLWLDDDEIPSAELVERLKTLDPEDKNMFLLPCVLHISSTGKDYYPVEPTPPKEYVNGMWTKQILFKKTPTLSFRFFGSHVIPEQSNKGYLAEPYYHLKTVESFVRNDVLQAFVHPEGQRYTPVEAAKFRLLTKKYETQVDFKKAAERGEWSPPLQKFAYDHKDDYDRPISRLAWWYWGLLGHPCFIKKNWNFGFLEMAGWVLGKENTERYNISMNSGKGIQVFKV